MPRALVPLAAGFEEIETTTIVDVLRRGGVDVVLAGLDGDGPCKGSRGIVVVPDVAFADAQGPWDLVALPGGTGGTQRMLADDALRALVRERVQNGELVAAVCAAPLVLDAEGALADKPFTCHPGVAGMVKSKGREDRAVVDAGAVVTSMAAGTSMDFALHLVERLTDADNRRFVEDGLQWEAPR